MANTKERLVVMNGYGLLQTEELPGKWLTEKVQKISDVKAGIYELFSAQAVDKGQTSRGLVLWVDDIYVYQETEGGTLIKHKRSAFSEVPGVGSFIRIAYSKTKAFIQSPELAN